MPDSLQSAARLLAASLQPVARALGGSDGDAIAFVEELGWTLPSVPPVLRTLGALAKDLADAHLTLDVDVSLQASGATVSGDIGSQYVALASKVGDLISQLRNLPSSLQAQLPPGFVVATGFPSQFAGRLLDLSIYELMMRDTKRMEPILRLAGIVEVVREPANPATFQPAYLRRTIRWDRLGKLLRDPASLFADAYGWGGNAFNGRGLLDALMHLSFALAGPAEIDWPTPQRVQAITGTLPAFDAVGPFYLNIPLIDQEPLHAAVSVLPLPAAAGAPPGIAFGLVVNAAVPATISLTDMLTVQLDNPTSLAGGVSVALRPGGAPQARIGLEGPSGSNLNSMRTGATLRIGRSVPMTLLSLPEGGGLQTGFVTVGGGVGLRGNGAEPYLDVGLKGGKLSLDLGDRDSFLQQIMPGDALEVNFDLGLAWTPSGLAVTGSGALTVSVPIHQQLGPFEIDSLNVVGNLTDSSLQLETSITGGAALGPLDATVDRIGLQTKLSFTPGNLGPLDLDFVFKAPNGVGLAVNAGVVQGGGYLFFDYDKGEYAGALELMLSGIVSLKAIGLITTKMPDGSKGFSLLIIITAEFGNGIQLGFGFTLLGVGGLLGLNRTVRLESLADAVRNGAVNNIMFPHDVIANAPRIISDLRAIFPAEEGKFLIGPMAKLGWGTPTLISLSLGIIIEIPGNLAILGVLHCILPTDDAAILVLQIAFIGAIEFDKKRLWLFAGLFESRVLFITLEGEMGVLAAFGEDANFVISVGGFHPRFTPPPLPFPVPRRLALDLLNEPGERIRIEGYFAVTTNTVQFGAHAELVFGFDDFGLQGHLGLDALFQFSPFYFIVQIGADLSLKAFGVGLFSVDLDFTLEGPTPYRAHGRGSISLLFFDISADFDVTWGETRDTTLPPIDIIPPLAAELDKLENWKAFLPVNANLLVSLRHWDPATEGLVLHPLGTLRISQRYVPLDSNIDKVGSQKAHDAKHFTLQVTSTDLVKIGDVSEQFAPAQFHDMSNADKLSKPAYTLEHGGVELSSSGQQLNSSQVVKRIARYEQIIIDTNFKRFTRKFRKYSGLLFDHFLRGNAVSKSPLSQTYKKQMQPFSDTIKAAADRFAVAFTDDNKSYKDDAVFTSMFAAEDYMEQAITANPELADSLHIIPHAEVNKAA